MRAAVVLLVTAWENYVEQVVAEAFAHVMVINEDPQMLSSHLQSIVAKAGKVDVWTVTGGGWRQVVQDEAAALIGGLNNAASGQVDGLIAKLLGIDSFLSSVTWQAFPPPDVAGDLRSLVNDVRGEIVHKGRTPSALNVAGFVEWRKFVDRLVDAVDRHLADRIAVEWGSAPW